MDGVEVKVKSWTRRPRSGPWLIEHPGHGRLLHSIARLPVILSVSTAPPLSGGNASDSGFSGGSIGRKMSSLNLADLIFFNCLNDLIDFDFRLMVGGRRYFSLEGCYGAG
jgi:hypothetical protein